MAKHAVSREKKAQERKKLRSALNWRALIISAFALAQLPALMTLDYYMGFTVSARPALKIIAAALCAAGLVMTVVHIVKKKRRGVPIIRPADISVMLFQLAAVCVCVGTYAFFAISHLYAAIPAFVICYLISCYLPRDLFVISLFCAVAGFDLYLLRGLTDRPLRYFIYAVALVTVVSAAAILAAVIFLPRKKKIGSFGLGRVTFVPPGASFLPLAVTLAAAIVTLSAAVIFNRLMLGFTETAALYMCWGLAGVFVLMFAARGVRKAMR